MKIHIDLVMITGNDAIHFQDVKKYSIFNALTKITFENFAVCLRFYLHSFEMAKKNPIVEICLFYLVVFWKTGMKHFDDLIILLDIFNE